MFNFNADRSFYFCTFKFHFGQTVFSYDFHAHLKLSQIMDHSKTALWTIPKFYFGDVLHFLLRISKQIIYILKYSRCWSEGSQRVWTEWKSGFIQTYRLYGLKTYASRAKVYYVLGHFFVSYHFTVLMCIFLLLYVYIRDIIITWCYFTGENSATLKSETGWHEVTPVRRLAALYM